MGFAIKCLVPLLWLGSILVQAQNENRTPFRHVVVVFQENRTPDNLFHGLLTWPGINPANYDIATFAVNSKGQAVTLEPVPLGVPYDLSHAHGAFVSMYDGGKMDGADNIPARAGVRRIRNLSTLTTPNTFSIPI